ncbi:MAG: DUF1571 domain-containing protein [Gemmataceae bacterium]
MRSCRIWLGLALVAAGIASAIAQGPTLGGNTAGQQSSPLVAAAQLLNEAQTSFARVNDYTGMFYKQERVNGQLNPEQTIQIRVRQQPFSVYLKWNGPQKFVGQEACFVSGKNSNMVRVKAATGLASAIGWVSIDPKGPRATANDRHSITDFGIGHLIERMTRNVDEYRKQPPDQTQITFGEYRFLQKACVRMETTHRTNTGQFYAARTVIYFDKETRLPVRAEAYDWPKAGGTQGGDLLECYSYVDMKFNVGLTDAAFNY